MTHEATCVDEVETDESPTGRAAGGGPQTAEGKENSRRNAWKHGLRAERLGLDEEDDDAFADLREALTQEYDPQTPTELQLVTEAWRHASFLHLAARAEGGCRRSAMRVLAANATGDDETDAALSGAASSVRMDLISRYRRSHERGFHQAISSLRNIREEREAKAVAADGADTWTNGEDVALLLEQFQTEADCVAFVRAGREAVGVACPACGGGDLRWIDAPYWRWECASCARQVGVRAGTVMESSHIPVSTWVRAAVLLIGDRNMSAAELQRRLGLPRYETVRALHHDIVERLPIGLPPDQTLVACFFGPRVRDGANMEEEKCRQN